MKTRRNLNKGNLLVSILIAFFIIALIGILSTQIAVQAYVPML